MPVGYSVSATLGLEFSGLSSAAAAVPFSPVDCAPVVAGPSIAGGGAGLSSVGAMLGAVFVSGDDMVTNVRPRSEQLRR